jgi:hypothetical protein
MTRDEFQLYHHAFCDDARAICKKKSKDYAKDADVYHNFTKCERDGLCSTEVGLMVRLSDKMIRLPNVIANGNACLDETALDTIQDAVNYLILLAGWLSKGGVQLELPLDDLEPGETKVVASAEVLYDGPIPKEFFPEPDEETVVYSTPPQKEKGYTAGPSEHTTYFKKADAVKAALDKVEDIMAAEEKETFNQQIAEAERVAKEIMGE